MDKSKVTWKVDMFDRVKLVCENNIVIVTGLPALDDAFTRFKAKLTDVKQRMEQLSLEENGYADTKQAAWGDLALKLNAICAGIRAYAKKQGNLELLAQAKFVPSTFTNGSSTVAIAWAGRLIELVNVHIASLANYNVTPAKVTAANDLLTELTDVNPKPVTQVTTDKSLRELLIKQVRETNALLKSEMDELVRTLEFDEPDFTGEYFAARRIRRTGIRHEEPTETAQLRENIESIEIKPDATLATAADTTTPSENGVNA